MLYRVEEEVRSFLVAQRESGMGYQLLQQNDVEGRILVLNAEIGVNVEHIHELAADQEDRGELPPIDRNLPVLSIDLQSVTVITHGSYRSTSREGDVFVRYSAFENDRRIRKDGSVVRGTYVTTETDALHWPPPYGWSGLAVVGRYALPSPAPAIYRFLMEPSRVSITCGTVTPAHGQSGGWCRSLF